MRAVIPSLAALLVALPVQAQPGPAFDADRFGLGQRVVGILKEHGVCTDSDDCARKQVFTLRPTRTGADIDLHGLPLAHAAIQAVSAACLQLAQESKPPMTIQLNVYATSREADTRDFGNRRDMVEIVFTRK